MQFEAPLFFVFVSFVLFVVHLIRYGKGVIQTKSAVGATLRGRPQFDEFAVSNSNHPQVPSTP